MHTGLTVVEQIPAITERIVQTFHPLVPTDVVVATPEEIARRGDLVGTVLRPALREGKVLYERE
jgi:hypothetical protein